MSSETHGQPYIEVEAKRSFDKVAVSFDWHDFLANKWGPGMAVATNACIRLQRSQSKGLQFRASTGGVTGSRMPIWPRLAGSTVTDGSVTWTAEAVTDASLRTTISVSDFPAITGVVLSAESNADQIYTILVDGGTSGQDYEIRHQVTLANGEEKEGVAVLPVLD